MIHFSAPQTYPDDAPRGQLVFWIELAVLTLERHPWHLALVSSTVAEKCIPTQRHSPSPMALVCILAEQVSMQDWVCSSMPAGWR